MAETVQLILTVDQAAAISEACEVLARLGIGQIEYVAEMVRFGVIRPHTVSAEPDTKFNADRSEAVADLCDAIKRELRMPVNGSRGIGHPHNPMQVRRAYEVKKVIDKALAEHREPNPSFRNVNYDGLGPRYTSDPAPQAVVLPASAPSTAGRA